MIGEYFGRSHSLRQSLLLGSQRCLLVRAQLDITLTGSGAIANLDYLLASDTIS
ncbi:MAG: hypothetical protein F6K09_02115 [Merismopedia sp. SIO2A8]|nr:hypothetical protein [Merismopedia sp. SIO2A8]